MAPKDRLTAKAEAIFNAVQKLRDNNEMTVVTAKQIEELEIEQGELQRKKKSLHATYEKSIDDYTRRWNREFATRFLELLTARELRDEVYLSLIGNSPNAAIFPTKDRLPANKYNDYFFHLPLIDRRGRSQRRGHDNELAHYFRDKFMGEEFAIEIAQIFHRHAIYKVLLVDDAAQFLRDGPLIVHPSCQPRHYIRTLQVTMSMGPTDDDYWDDEDLWDSDLEDNWKKEDFEPQLIWLNDLKELDQVSQFQLTLNVNTFHSSTIGKYKAMLLPHIQELVEKGCKVTIFYISANMYQGPTELEKIIYDGTMLLSTGQLESLVADAFNDAN